MYTTSAARSLNGTRPVDGLATLIASGWTSSAVASQVRAHRWQRFGRAVLRHNAEPTASDWRAIALVNAGPRAALTSFTALEDWGLTGWERDLVHVLVPRGARVLRPAGAAFRIHWTDRWSTRDVHPLRGLHRPAQAAVLAAAGFGKVRPACGVLAAVVQQGLARPEQLVDAVTESVRVRHRAALLAAAHDIGQGARALSEIDFARICRAAGLPEPVRQAVRTELGGRRRYLDAEWRDSRGRRVVAEIDGALHLAASRWWDDQLRQNELTIADDRVLRFPSVIVRFEPEIVVDQLRRMLGPPAGR